MTNNTICSRCKCKNEDGLGVMKNGKNYKTCVNCRTKRKNYYRNGIYNTETEEVIPGISDSDTICSIITNCPIAFGETCPICLDNCGSNSIKLDCGHPICVECFENLLYSKHAKILELTKNINCPICRNYTW